MGAELIARIALAAHIRKIDFIRNRIESLKRMISVHSL